MGHKILVSANEGIACSDDVGLVEPVDGLAGALEESCSELHTFITCGKFVEFPERKECVFIDDPAFLSRCWILLIVEASPM